MYLRSSKDRSDVSLAAQRHELEKLATSRSLTVVKAYEDAVESGSTDQRPGFIELVRALKNSSRGWDYLLVYDTSRIARRRYIAQAIKHEAKKRGVTILYARMPADLVDGDLNPPDSGERRGLVAGTPVIDLGSCSVC